MSAARHTAHPFIENCRAVAAAAHERMAKNGTRPWVARYTPADSISIAPTWRANFRHSWASSAFSICRSLEAMATALATDTRLASPKTSAEWRRRRHRALC